MGGGVKYYFNRSVGLRLQARLNVPFYFYGVSLYAGYGAAGGSAMAQGDISAGLFVALPK